MKKLKINFKNIEIEFLDSTSSIKIKKHWSTYWQRVIGILAHCTYSYLKKNQLISLKQHWHISVYYCGLSKIIKLNQSYRGKNRKTDVLSFPIHYSIINNEKHVKQMPAVELGDIFICHQVLKSQAMNFKMSLEEEFFHLFVHGFLHLLGYDHEVNAKEELKMQKQEAQLLKIISFYLKEEVKT